MSPLYRLLSKLKMMKKFLLEHSCEHQFCTFKMVSIDIKLPDQVRTSHCPDSVPR
jgi:hypothetical protein